MRTARSLNVSRRALSMPSLQSCTPPANIHAPWQPCIPPSNHTHPLQLCMPPPGNHACPLATMHTPLATMHAPQQPHTHPHNHTCPPATMHAPQQQHMPIPPGWTESQTPVKI